ncbi:MAG: CPBP family intramembrane glutamic endopeptidase [Roseovarius sp.]
MRYAAHEILTAPARPSANPLRLLAGVVLGTLVFLSMAFMYAGTVPGLIGVEAARNFTDGGTPLAVIVMLAEFVFLFAALALVLRALHRRGLGSLVGPLPRAVRQFARCTAALLPLYLITLVLPMPEPYRLEPNLGLSLWLSWLPLGLFCVFIQIGAEEFVFRGYLQSQLAARFRHPLVWLGLPSFAFGMLHYDTGLAGENAWMVALWATLFGLVAADLTARSGTLGPALALHFINNIFAILVTAPLGSLDGLALYTFPLPLDEEGIAWAVLPVETLFTLCAWLAARLTLRA